MSRVTMGVRWRLFAAVIMTVGALAAVAWNASALRRAFEPDAASNEPLTAYVPQGSLLAIESPDFAALLASWTNSPEEKAWIGSDNYADFSRSRLFSRLGEAQGEFAASAGLAPDAKFLEQVAGHESVFAWYDIGKLEFLYVTRMKPGDAAANPLLKLEDHFQLRKAGTDSFYIRTQSARDDQGNEAGAPRTVAFATHGDLLLLATREDLIANALLLAQHQGNSTLRNEPWYVAAVSAVGEGSGRPDLRMTLNLARIVPSPYFRSYWVQENVSELRKYTAAVSDLYHTAGEFREDRVLIPRSSDADLPTADLGAILRYLPSDSGVYRASAHPGSDDILEQLNRRVLTRAVGAYRDLRIAPVADLSDTSVGTSSDLETRIDEQPVPQLPASAALASLRRVMDAARPDSILVYSSTTNSGDSASYPDGQAVYLPIHTAVVLASAAGWDSSATQRAFLDALRERLTVGGIGLAWQPRRQQGESWVQLPGMQPMALAFRGGVLVVASDPETLLDVLKASRKPQDPGSNQLNVTNATTVAGFSHAAERQHYLRLTRLLDRGIAGQPSRLGNASGDTPAFFSGNIGSLSQTFAALDTETFVELPGSAHAVRQTVIYRWRP
jgi:hypothetical protein